MDILGGLQESLGRDCYRLSSDEVRALTSRFAVDTDMLLRTLVDFGKDRALVPISGFCVGSAGLTESGEIFLGVNLEYAEAAFAQTVHSEQFLLSWSRACSGSRLTTIAVSAPPCGHCRQFLRESDPAGALRLLIGLEPPVEARGLLPRAFTPLDLDVEEPFFGPALCLDGANLEEAARRAMERSYAPYSGVKAGLALRLKDGRIFAGSALENAAFNPTLPPLQAALIVCHAHGVATSEIEEIVLSQGEGRICHEAQARALAEALGVAPTSFHVI